MAQSDSLGFSDGRQQKQLSPKWSVDNLYARLDNRWNSPIRLQRYIHRTKIQKILRLLSSNQTLLDIGRGGSVDGILGVMAAKAGLRVTITNVAKDNINVIRRFAQAQGVEGQIEFKIGDPHRLPLPDQSFDIVSALHVLEHLPDFNAGLTEMHRVSRRFAVVALPTCLNPAVFSRLGGASPYSLSVNGPPALIKGALMVLYHFAKAHEGVNETEYELGEVVIHQWLFPWKMRRNLESVGFQILKFQPDAICLPWFSQAIPVMRVLDGLGSLPVLREIGFGSHALMEKETRSA